jgi:hypothetical protein
VCRTAHENGAAPGDVLAVVKHFQEHPGAWTLGLLAGRASNAAPGLAPTAGWPHKAAAAARSTPKRTASQQRDAEDFDAMQVVRRGRKLQKTDDQIQADLVRAGLGEASDRLGWKTESEAMTK